MSMKWFLLVLSVQFMAFLFAGPASAAWFLIVQKLA
jgi:hypothetical protein